MSYYFDEPKQVVFWDDENVQYQPGIAYHDEVICACCGAVIPLQAIIDELPADVLVPIYVFDDWIDLSEDVCPEYFDFIHNAKPYGVNNDDGQLSIFDLPNNQ